MILILVFLMIYLMQMNYRVLINQLRHVLEYMVQIIKTILLPAPGKNDRNFKKVFKLFLIHDNRMLAECAFYCFTCPLRGGSPAKQAQGRQCVLANKNCPGTLFPNRTIYLFYRTQHRWAVFSSGSRCCRFQSEKGIK